MPRRSEAPRLRIRNVPLASNGVDLLRDGAGRRIPIYGGCVSGVRGRGSGLPRLQKAPECQFALQPLKFRPVRV